MSEVLYSVVYFVLATLSYSVLADLDVCLKDLGCLRGTMMPGYQKEPFEAFMGIPFAQPPIGDLRFRHPKAATSWTGVLDASMARNNCLQKCYLAPTWPIYGDEDCLYLNVYRPVQRSASPLPVMVYIHSGGFLCGSAQPAASGPEYLMDTQQVIMVTISYRLGPFGFLSTGDSHMPGNFGLKDQRMALQWVQQHIASFGGNSQLVTIFGHSAGGISAHFHMLSSNSNGLYQRAMSLGGTAFMPPAFVNKPLSQAQQLAERVGVALAKSLNTQQLADALRQADAIQLLEGGDVLKHWQNLPVMNYGAVVEQDATSESFFNEHPTKAHLAGHINQVPWLLSANTRAGEGSIFILHIYENEQLLKDFNANFLELFGILLHLPQATRIETVKEILKLYDVEKFELNKENLATLSGILGDFMFSYPLYVTSSSYAAYAKEPLSIYRFEYRSLSNISFVKMLVNSKVVHDELGAAHMDDALHTIHYPVVVPDFPKGSEDDLVIKRMTSLLVEFAKTGIFYNATDLQPCKTSDFTADEICNYLHFGRCPVTKLYKETIERGADMRALSLWKKIFL